MAFWKTTSRLLGFAVLGGVAIPASAMLIYNNFEHAGSDPVDYEVTVEHDALHNEFDITYKVTASSPNTTGKLTGLFFDFGPINTATLPDPDTSEPYNVSNLGLANEINPSGTIVCGQAFGDVNSVSGSGGCNSTLNLGTTIIDGVDYMGFLFDVGLAWKVNDISSGAMGSFSISDLGPGLGGLTLDDWGAVGVRGQATNGPGGSAKEFQLVADNGGRVQQIPEPTAMVLLGISFFGLGAARLNRRRQGSRKEKRGGQIYFS